MKSIMFQGTGSSVGKSIIAAAFCRIFREDGYRTVPFKSQNMALNSYITDDGLEMGRAQVVQAEAAGIKPSVLMNPILLKPTSSSGSQVIVRGRVYKNMGAQEYYTCKHEFLRIVEDAYRELTRGYDIAVIEGAGSPAEINLKGNDIVNMRIAELTESPVVLIGDIDRGGVFASLVGTLILLDEDERKRVKGVIINKFRGDVNILKPGLRQLEEIIKVPVLGVIPYFDIKIDDEDSLTERFGKEENREGSIRVEVVRLPYMSNFTDFSPLETQPDVQVVYINPGERPGDPDLLVIPGSKNTIEDMAYLRESGLEQDIIRLHQRGRYIFGICGGYQILGRKIRDPYHVESSIGCIDGLGLLDVDTTISRTKTTTQVEGILAQNKALLCHLEGQSVQGYEIHMGNTSRGGEAQPFAYIKSRFGDNRNIEDGAVNGECNVAGTYIHGIFDNIQFTRGMLNNIRHHKGLPPLQSGIGSYREFKENQYKKLAQAVRQSVDVNRIYEIMGVKDCV